jgi:two-component system, NarL family, nitrate/nitrite response regulator NarL
MTTSDIRVLVVDEGPGLVQALTLALPRRWQVRILGPVPDAPDALAVLEDDLADLVVVSLDRADGRGTDVVGALRDGIERVKVLAASRRPGLDVAVTALAAGACGVLPAARDRSLIGVFRRALAGELVLPAAELPRLVDRLTGVVAPTDGSAEGRAVIAGLTEREREILGSLADGRSTADIATSLGISPMTVQSHVKSILSKLRVHSKVEAVRLAWRHGLGHDLGAPSHTA